MPPTHHFGKLRTSSALDLTLQLNHAISESKVNSTRRPLSIKQALQILREATLVRSGDREFTKEIAIPRATLHSILGMAPDNQDFFHLDVNLATYRTSEDGVHIALNAGDVSNPETMAKHTFEGVKAMGEKVFAAALSRADRGIARSTP